MYTMLLGAALGLLPAQTEGAAAERLRLPFETGQVRITNGNRQRWLCTAVGIGRGYEGGAGACGGREAASTPPAPGGDQPEIETVVVIGFTRAGERQLHPVEGRGRRLLDVEAEVELDPGGAIAGCRILSTRGTVTVLFGSGDVCRELRNEPALFAAASGAGLRQGRLRLTFFVTAPPAEIERMLRPAPTVQMSRIAPPIRTMPPPMMMPMASPPPPPMPPPGSRPQPISRQSWITSDDYPAAAMRNEEEGSVTVRLDVTPAGRVGGCTILSSSGSASLDSATCRIFRSRARYHPARTAGGEPAAGTVIERVRWELPEDGTLPLEPAYAALAVSLDGDRRTACTSIDEAPEDTALTFESCGLLLPVALPVPRAIGQGHSRIRVTLELTRDGVPRPSFARQAGPPIYAATAALEVREDGMVVTCRAEMIVPPRAASVEPFDLCARIQRQNRPLFHERTAGSGALTARMVVIVRQGAGRR